jgi:cobalt/nickel transport system permease protein
MHVAEGVAPVPVAVAGGALAIAGIAIGLRSMKDEQIPRAAVTSAAIFAASVVIRLPLGPSAVHPVLNGLAGIVLGWAAMPVFLVALLLQALLFQFGGITTLGINTVVMGLPAVVSYWFFGRRLGRSSSARAVFLLGSGASVAALILSFVLWAIALLLCGKQLAVIVGLAAGPHLGLIVVEGLFTGFVASFLWRVYPSIFEAPAMIRGEGQS